MRAPWEGSERGRTCTARVCAEQRVRDRQAGGRACVRGGCVMGGGSAARHCVGVWRGVGGCDLLWRAMGWRDQVVAPLLSPRPLAVFLGLG
jgi:hypothetical protein